MLDTSVSIQKIIKDSSVLNNCNINDVVNFVFEVKDCQEYDK